MLIFPTEAANAGLARRLEYCDLHGFTVNASVSSLSLVGSDGHQRVVVNGFDETVAERVQNSAKRANILGVGKLFVRLGTCGAIVND